MLEIRSCASISRVDPSDGADALGNKWEGGGVIGGIGPITEAELALGSGHIGVIGVDNKCEGGGVIGGIGRIGHIGAEICFGGGGAITTRTCFAGGGITTGPHDG